MKHNNFFSSVLKEIEWEDGILSVTFKNDKVFQYQAPVDVYYELAGAASIGSHYSKNVKGKYPLVQKPDVNNTTMIKMQVIGNLGKDAVVKEVNGKNVINFSVAHTENYTNAKGEKVSKTTWVECAYWSDKTAVAQYLTKGKQVYVEGIPEADAYLDKEGKAASTQRLRVQNIQLLGGGSEASGTGTAATAAAPAAAASAAPGPVDDLPF